MKTIRNICICILVILLLPFQKITAAEDLDSGLDVVIVIDTSGSMRQTDPNKIAIEAAKLFIDMMENTGSRVAIVPFSDKLGNIVELTEINSVNDKDNIKKNIDKLNYTGDTDIGLAMHRSLNILNNSKDIGNQKAILFFTDGKIDLGNKTTRTNEDSLKDTNEVVTFAAINEIPIYTIGLNADGGVDKTFLQNIALETKGNNYIVDNAGNLPEIYNEIFAEFINSNILELGEFETNGVDFTEIIFEIPNNSVLEANIIMLSSKTLQQIELIDPDGKHLEMNDKGSMLSQSKQYNMLKLINPSKGEWLLRINGVKSGKVNVNLILNYKISLECSAEIIMNDDIAYLAVTSWLNKEGVKLKEQSLYQAFTGNVHIITNQNETEYSMELKDEYFYAEIPIVNTGVYKIYTKADSKDIYRISDIITIEVSEDYELSPDIVSGLKNEKFEFKDNFIEQIELKGYFWFLLNEKIKISNYVSGIGQNKVSYYISEPDSDVIKAKLTNDVLEISAVKTGNTSIIITVQDSNGNAITKEINILVDCEVSDISQVLFVILIIIVLLCVLKMAAVILNRRKNQRSLYGTIRWQLVNSSGIGKKDEISCDISDKKGIVSLSDIINCLEISFSLRYVYIRMNPAKNILIFDNKDTNVSLFIGFLWSSKKTVKLHNNDFLLITANSDKGNAIDKVILKVTFVLNNESLD